MLLSASRSLLVVVDVQERLLPAVADWHHVVERCGTLLRAAAELGVPALASEQYPKGLGPTEASLTALIPDTARIEKLAFSCAAEPAFMAALEASGRDQIVLTGIESHVCVLQTALGLRANGFNVFMVADAVSSRASANIGLALGRAAKAGVHIVSSEMVMFEWLERAGTPVFKTVSALIK